ncbi:MAG TPA: hypothetical protein VK034_27735 [Enhygromyxa sp.]|nr:hypothetical protein [Enhygromyxa sp.]
MRRIFVTLSLGLFSFASLTACGSGAKDADKSDKSATKKQDPEPAAKQPEDPKPAPPEQVHFDIEKDKSGILARTASTLETSDRVSADNPVRSHLAELSHHSETGPSNEGLCTHIVELRSTEEPETCATTIEHERVLLGPEVFAQMSECIMAAKTLDELAACEAAEKEAEHKLHANKHGDGLSEEVCTQMFDHFEKLAMDDAGDQAEVVKEILEEVRADVLVACVDQGTQKEIDCALKAKTMEELGGCESSLI